MTSPDSPTPRPRPQPGGTPRPRPTPVSASAPAAPPVEATPPARGRSRVLAVAVTAAVLIVALVVLNVLFAVKRSHQRDADRARQGQEQAHRQQEQARTDAVAAARTRVPALLSYTYKTIGTYQQQAPTNATGSFRTDFTKLITALVVPAARQNQIVTTAKVLSVGVIAASPTSVKTLVLLDQSTYDKDSKTAQVTGSRAEVTMTRVGSSWLIGNLTKV